MTGEAVDNLLRAVAQIKGGQGVHPGGGQGVHPGVDRVSTPPSDNRNLGWTGWTPVHPPIVENAPSNYDKRDTHSLANSQAREESTPFSQLQGWTPVHPVHPPKMTTRHHRNPEKFRPTTCPHCGSAILAGQAATGLWTNLEPWPLDDHGEAAALADGRHTFDLAKDMTASHRWVWSIWYADAVMTPRVRHAEHRCGVTYAQPPEQTFELISEVATAPDDVPPF